MTAQASSTPQEGRRRAAASARFEPPRLPLLLLVLKGWGLTALTAGAYRFWAVAEFRAYMWRHLSLGGERFEYDGSAARSLVRFLIEAAVAVPVIAAVLFGIFALRDYPPPVRLAGLALSIVVAAFLLLVQQFRHRQYLMSHTVWRGIRVGMDGSPLVYALIAMAGWFGALVTLGLAYPWMRSRCWNYQISRARFGNRQLSFEAPSGPPFGAWLIVWLSALGVLIWFVGINQAALLTIAEGWRDGFPPDPGPPLDYIPLAGLALPVIFYVRYRVREFRFIAAATSLGRIDLESSMPTVSPVIAVLLHWFLVLIGIGLAVLWLNRTAIEAAQTLEPVGILFPLWLGLLAIVYVSIVKTLWLRCEILRTVCRRLLIGELAPLQMIDQYESPTARRVRQTGAAMAAAAAQGD